MQCTEHPQNNMAVGTQAPSYRYFTNTSCEFFPCHKLESSEFNCLFCYCPLYNGECPGTAAYVTIKGKEVKDCSECDFPHVRENYDDMIRCLMEKIT